MSKYSTINQRIKKNLMWLFLSSQDFIDTFNDYWKTFERIETKCHFSICHNEPVKVINFDEEEDSIKALINNYSCSKNHYKKLKKYYEVVSKTNKLIKEKYRLK